MEWHSGAALGDPPAPGEEARERHWDRIWRWTVGGISALGLGALAAAVAASISGGAGAAYLPHLDNILAMASFGIAAGVVVTGGGSWRGGLRLDTMVLVAAFSGIGLLSLGFVVLPGNPPAPGHIALHQSIGLLAALGIFTFVRLASPIPLSGWGLHAAVWTAGPALAVLLAVIAAWAAGAHHAQFFALLAAVVDTALYVSVCVRLYGTLRRQASVDAACLLACAAAGILAEFLFLLAADRNAWLDATAHGYRVAAFALAYAAVANQSARRSFPQPQPVLSRMAPGESRFRNLLELASDWYWETDDQHRFTLVEGWTAPLFGAPPEHYVGRKRWDLPVHNMTEQDWVSHRERLNAHEPFHDLLLETENWAGETRWIVIGGRPLVDAEGRFRGYCGFGRDVTDQQRVEQAARQERELLANAQKLARLGRWEWNIPENRMWASEEVLRMFGLESGEGLAREDFQRCIHHDDREKVIGAANAAVERDVPYSIAYRVFRADGTARTVHSEAQVLRSASGQALRFIGTCQDISARVAAEQALRDSEARIRSLNADLERRVEDRTRQLAAANKELEAFSYSVSHDLQAPLRRIERYAELLLETNGMRLDDSGRDMLNRVRGASVHTKRLIEDMLKLAKVSRADLTLAKADLSGMARDALEQIALHTDRAVEISIEEGLVVHADAAMLRIVLDNLLGNAWKFTARTPAARITVKRPPPAAGNGFLIQDNGAGFDMRYAQKLFGAFQRLHAQEEFQGSGIGLAIVQRIVNLHGWRIEAAGEPGAGATFTVLTR